MAKGKRYWWAKLMSDYFERIEIKQLRSMPGGIGDVLCVIALKIQLHSLQNNGLIIYKGVCDDMVEEIALAVNEDAKNVKMAMDWLQRHHWATPVDSGYVITMLEWGSEGESAERMRKYRGAMEPASHCAHNVTTEQRTEKMRKEQDSVVDMSDEQEVIDKWGVGEMVRALATVKRQPKLAPKKAASNNTELYNVVEPKSGKEYEWSQYPSLVESIVVEHGLQDEVQRALKRYKPEKIDEKLLYLAAKGKYMIIDKPAHYFRKALAEDWTDGGERDRANRADCREEELEMIQRQRGLPP